MIPFNIEFKPGIPIYKQLVYAVKKAIVSGQLVAGDRFPSVRTLSQELHVNPNTVRKTITNLINDKLLEVRPDIGCVVAETKEATIVQRKEILDVEVEKLVVETKRFSLREEDLLNAIQECWKRFKEGE